MDRLKFRLAITTLAAVVALAFWGRVRAADNMCNTAGWNCTTQQDWERGWGAARQPENNGAVPTQTEYTNANDDKDPNTPGTQAEVIRNAGESGVGDPGDGNRNRGGITVETGQTYSQGGNDSGVFGGKKGVMASQGANCDDRTQDPGTGQQGLVCRGSSIEIHVCSGGPSGSRTDNGVTREICIVSSPIINTSGSVDCVAEANARCAFVQIDVQGPTGGAITCYPTDYSRCGAAAVSGGRPSVTVTGNGGGGGGSTPMPKVPKKTPKPTPTPTPTSTPTPTPIPTPTPTPTPPPVLGVSAPPVAPEAGLATNLTLGLVLVGLAGVLVRVIAVAVLL